MTKQLFLNELAAALHSLPREERYRTLGYYDELIDDRMEDGQSEEEAVSGLGEPEQVAVEGDINSLASAVWDALDEANRISLFVRFTDLETHTFQQRIVNKYQPLGVRR